MGCRKWEQTEQSEGSSQCISEREVERNQPRGNGQECPGQTSAAQHWQNTKCVWRHWEDISTSGEESEITWGSQKSMKIHVQNKTITCYKENKKMDRKGNLIVMAQLPFYYLLVSTTKTVSTDLGLAKQHTPSLEDEGWGECLCGGRWAPVKDLNPPVHRRMSADNA